MLHLHCQYSFYSPQNEKVRLFNYTKDMVILLIDLYVSKATILSCLAKGKVDWFDNDEDMTPTDTTIDYKVHSFLYLHSNSRYNSLGSTCTCRYLNVGTNMSQSASPSKLNFRFVGSPIVLYWEGHNSSIRSAIEVNESGPTSISHWQGFQIIETFCHYFCRVLRRRRGLVIHTWGPGPSWSTPQEYGKHLRDAQGRPPPWPPP
jgi:hypothetical protein